MCSQFTRFPKIVTSVASSWNVLIYPNSPNSLPSPKGAGASGERGSTPSALDEREQGGQIYSFILPINIIFHIFFLHSFFSQARTPSIFRNSWLATKSSSGWVHRLWQVTLMFKFWLHDDLISSTCVLLKISASPVLLLLFRSCPQLSLHVLCECPLIMQRTTNKCRFSVPSILCKTLTSNITAFWKIWQ